MEIQFREFNPFDLWIWLEFPTVPSRMEQQYIEELLDSWFYLGKLGGFNAENLPVQDAGIEISYMDYDESQLESTLMSPMHNMGDIEYLGVWGRCWFDLGTSDLIAIDILINSIYQLSKEFVQINKIIVGGQNEDWPVNDNHNSNFYSE
ncbi:DUF3531 domain-containing protein [Pleurocapsa sp. CCALA 161]|uniref:DUF3531 family protein n=1 Tax=Pleurocapsa sp. CCALA 161 TaxID=2107688 RepID=UPI000D082099|nr:DUF3531 family protein [Pleurocapsa sp. CCALA 161]PSB08576.1 DUF3531 domain-containing protein [Pleurocapsa sp. CCALA 161]